MILNKPILIKKNQTNIVKTSSGKFKEYVSWKQSKDIGIGIATHKTRFPKDGYLKSLKVDECILLLDGNGRVIVKTNDEEQTFDLEKEAILFIPKNTMFYFEPLPKMKILSATGPAWYPRQQKGLDYRRKESGRMIL